VKSFDDKGPSTWLKASKIHPILAELSSAEIFHRDQLLSVMWANVKVARDFAADNFAFA